MRKPHLIPFLIAATLLTPVAGAADKIDGKALHDSICLTCHKPDYYTRKNRIVHSAAELKAQVGRCQTGAGENWSADQIDAVATYLNSTYYKFK